MLVEETRLQLVCKYRCTRVLRFTGCNQNLSLYI